jgi:hypothetical protein
MSTSTYGGVVRELPIIPYAVAPASTLQRGNLVEWDTVNFVVKAWGGTNPLFGVCIGAADTDRNTIDVYVRKGSTVQVLLDTAITAVIGSQLFWSTAGVAKITGTAGQQFATVRSNIMNGQLCEATLI